MISSLATPRPVGAACRPQQKLPTATNAHLGDGASAASPKTASWATLPDEVVVAVAQHLCEAVAEDDTWEAVAEPLGNRAFLPPPRFDVQEVTERKEAIAVLFRLRQLDRRTRKVLDCHFPHVVANRVAEVYWRTAVWSGPIEPTLRLQRLCDNHVPPPEECTPQGRAAYWHDRSVALDRLANATSVFLQLLGPSIPEQVLGTEVRVPQATIAARLCSLASRQQVRNLSVAQAGGELWHLLVQCMPPHVRHLLIDSEEARTPAEAQDFRVILPCLPLGLRSLRVQTPRLFTAEDWTQLLQHLPSTLQTLCVVEQAPLGLQAAVPSVMPWPCPATQIEELMLDVGHRGSLQAWQLTYLLETQKKLRTLFISSDTVHDLFNVAEALGAADLKHVRWARVATTVDDPLLWLARLWHSCETLHVYGGRLGESELGSLDVEQATRLKTASFRNTAVQKERLALLGRSMPEGLHHLIFRDVWLLSARDWSDLADGRRVLEDDGFTGGVRAQQLIDGDLWSLV